MTHDSPTSTAHSHAGSVRPLNEDASLNEPGVGLWCVADGMGGHLKGEIASGLIVEKLSKLTTHPGRITLDSIASAIDEANSELTVLAKQLGEKVGSTVAVLFINNDTAHLLWAGDSRIYHLSDNKLVQLTNDHNQAAELVRYGFLTPEAAKRHPGSSLLTRAVGTNKSVSLDHKSLTVQPSDKFILCSDGLNTVMEEDGLAEQLRNAETNDLSHWLIARALDRWALDNITAVVVEC